MNKVLDRIKNLNYFGILILAIVILQVALLGAYSYKACTTPRRKFFISGSEFTLFTDIRSIRQLDSALELDITDAELKLLDSDPIAKAWQVIPMGNYWIDIEYETKTDVTPLVDDHMCYIHVENDDIKGKITENIVPLDDNKTHVRYLLPVFPNRGGINVKLSLYAKSIGKTVLKGISISESIRFRLLAGGLYVLICVLFDIGIWFFFRLSPRKRLIWGGLVFLCVFTLIPMFREGMIARGDSPFHLRRMGEIAESIRKGVFPVYYSIESANGYGFLDHVFYPPLFLYPFAALHVMDLPLYMCFKMYMSFYNVITVLLAYYSYGRIFKSDILGLIGSGFVTLYSCRICYLYGQSALGRVTAIPFIPLLIYGIYLLWFDEGSTKVRPIVPLVISSLGLMYSHMITMELLVIACVIIGLINIKRILTTPHILKNTILSGLCVVLAGLGFIIPFFDAYRNRLLINTDNVLNMSQYIDLVEVFFQTYDDRYRATDMGLISLGGLVLAFAGVIISIRNKQKIDTAIIQVIILIVIIVGIMSVRMDWQKIMESRVGVVFASFQTTTQLTSIVVPLIALLACWGSKCIVSCYTAGKGENKIYAVIFLASLILSLPLLCKYYSEFCLVTERTKYTNMCAELQKSIGGEEWLPKDAVHHGLYDNSARVSGQSIQVKRTDDPYDKNRDKFFSIQNNGPEGYVDLPVYYYINMKAFDAADGNDISYYVTEDARIRLEVPEGNNGTIGLYYGAPILWNIAKLIGALFLAILIIKRPREL